MPEEHLWFYSAVMLGVGAVAVVYFMSATTQGAGFGCAAALIRLLQRWALGFLAVMMALLAVRNVAYHHSPTWEGFLFQIAFMLAWSLSAVRHLVWAPDIPPHATWRRPMVRTDARIKTG